MATRGSALQRVVTFFREAQLDEARVTFQLVEEVMQKRMEEYEAATKSQNRAAATPRKKRRTRQQIAADNAAKTASTGSAVAVPAAGGSLAQA